MAKTLAQVQQEVQRYQQELARMYLNNSSTTEVNWTRGRLIAALKKEYKLSTDPHCKSVVRSNLMVENGRHYNLLSNEVVKNKKSPNYSISKELGLKMRKLSAAKTDLVHAQTSQAQASGGLKLAGQTVSAAFTLLKYPTTIALKGVGVLAPYMGMAFAQIFQLPALLLTKFINPDSPYNGQTITKMGRGLGELISQLSHEVDSGVKRL